MLHTFVFSTRSYILFCLTLIRCQAATPDQQSFQFPPLPVFNLFEDKPTRYSPDASTVTVDTTVGKVRGFQYRTPEGNAGNVFLGIPYAEPPVGDLRFAKPVSKKPWVGVLDAFNFSAPCTQLSDFYEEPPREDCLTLDIRAPLELNPKEKYPVIFYVYGGAFDAGSTRSFDPAFVINSFTRQDIIFITLNYRIGVMAYFSTGTDDAPGNMQHRDLILGLEWTKREIGAFGGDPSRVTIMGHSSGAINVNQLALSPLTKDLFHQAIPMSGSALVPALMYNELDKYRLVATEVGCNDKKEWEDGEMEKILTCMRKVNHMKLAVAYAAASAVTGGSAPRIDGPDGVFPADIFELAERRRPMPYLLGTASNETPMGNRSNPQLSHDAVAASCFAISLAYRKEKAAAPCVYFYDVQQREKDKIDFHFLEQRVKLLLSDATFYTPVYKDAATMRRAGGKVYLYNFEYIKEGFEETSVQHAEDLVYIFGYPDFGFSSLNEEDRRIGRKYSDFFGNFVKYGNPTPPKHTDPGIPFWNELRRPIGFNYFRIDRNCSNEDFFHYDPVEFWDRIVTYL